MSTHNGPGEGTWSVFAEKAAAARDEAQRKLAEVGEILGAAKSETVEEAARRVVSDNIMLREVETLHHSLRAVTTLCAERGQSFEYDVCIWPRALRVLVRFHPRWGEDMVLEFTAVGSNNVTVLTELKRKMDLAGKGLVLFNGTFGDT